MTEIQEMIVSYKLGSACKKLDRKWQITLLVGWTQSGGTAAEEALSLIAQRSAITSISGIKGALPFPSSGELLRGF